MEKHYRYPGTQPFSVKDRALFFGRTEDIKKLSQLIVLEKLVVLVGRSGFGKTSLLNAGLIPKLIEQERHVVLNIHLKEQARSPMDLLLQRLESLTNEKTFLSNKFNIATELPKDPTAKLWYYAKIIQLLHEGAEAVTLIFDHFEELFVKYPNHVDTFSQSIAKMLNFRSPKSVRDLLTQKVKSDENYFSKEEIEQLLAPLNLKVVLSLRNDYMGELDRLKKFLPEVFNYTYELLPLSGPQTLEALVKPAQMEGDFSSPSFTYTQEVLEHILKGLMDTKNKRFEAFQLQLIGQYAEEKISNRKKTNPETTEFEFTVKDLWKKDKNIGNLDLIWEKYYNKIIAGLPIGKSRQNLVKDPLKPKNPITVIRKSLISRPKVKNFIETVLIVEGNRVPVDIVTIEKKHKIPKIILDNLEDNLLLRPFLNSVGTTSYELSHDTLVEPILISTEKRRKKEKRLLLFALGFLALLVLVLGSLLAVKPKEYKPLKEIITFEIPKNEGPDGTVDPSSLDSIEFTIVTYPCKPQANAHVTITATNSMEGYRYEIIQPDGTKLGPRTQNAFFNLSQIGKYDIIVSDASGTTKKHTFNVTENCESTVNVDDRSTENNYSKVKLPIKIDEPKLSDKGVIKKIPPRIAYPDKPNNTKEYITWIARLRAIKEKMKTEPAERNEVRNWHFNKDEIHLVGIRKDNAGDPTHDEVLVLLLMNNKVFKFKSIIPHLKEDSPLTRQRKYDLRVSLQRGSLYKDSLAIASKRFINHRGSAIDSIQYKEQKDIYDVFATLIRNEQPKDKPKQDEIYYTFLDEKFFDKEARDLIKIAFGDLSKAEYLPFQM